MLIEIKTIKNLLIIFSVLVFTLVSLFGVSHTANMGKSSEDGMEGCIFTGKAMICKMDVTGHISAWQNLFIAIAQKIDYQFLVLQLLLVAMVSTLIYSLVNLLLRKPELLNPALYILQHPDYALFNSLRRAFSQGLIQPKIYESAGL